MKNGRVVPRETLDRLLPLVYEDLKRVAHNRLRTERPSATLNTTVLVHEVYPRLVDHVRIDWSDRSHLLVVASMAMRRILIDRARKKSAVRRGGRRRQVPLNAIELSVEDRADLLVDLDEALTRLATVDERLGRVVEYRFFGGLTEQEIATALGVTERTVRRDWRKARAFLYGQLTDQDTP